MRKRSFWILIVLMVVSFIWADWMYNPETGAIDYYEPVSGSVFGDLGDVTFTTLARGDVVYRGAATWRNLPKGTAGQVLAMGANDPHWISDVQHADIYHTDFIGTDYYNCGNSGASITIDWNNGNLQHVTLTAVGVDITFTEPPHPGRCELHIIQDGIGNRTIDWTHEINPEWPGGVAPTLSTGAADVDIIIFTFVGGTTYRGLFNGDFS